MKRITKPLILFLIFMSVAAYSAITYLSDSSPEIARGAHEANSAGTKYNLLTKLTNEFLLDVAKGNVAGHSLVIVRGHNPDIDTGSTEDIRETGGTKTQLATAQIMLFASTSALDDVGSTGMETILVQGVDDDYIAIQEFVNMDGATGTLTTLAYLHINNVVGWQAGTGLTNDGNITATAQAGGTIQSEMDAGESVSQDGHYVVPANNKGYLYQVELNASKISGGGNNLPVVEFFGYGRQPSLNANAPWIQLFDKRMDTQVTDELDVSLPFPTGFPEKTIIRIAGATDINNTEARVRLYIMLVAD